MERLASTDLITSVGTAVELLGVVTIALAALIATLAAARSLWGRAVSAAAVYEEYRRRLGRGILLGLEFLVAGDIIRTVAVEPSFRGIGVLALIVLIRTFLSFTLELETSGRWPWQQNRREVDRGG